jgi:hypothetical protein
VSERYGKILRLKMVITVETGDLPHMGGGWWETLDFELGK